MGMKTEREDRKYIVTMDDRRRCDSKLMLVLAV